MTLNPIDYKSHSQTLQSLSNVLFEYLLVISPDDVSSFNLSQIKNIFKMSYGCEYAASLNPHITLINFGQLEINERPIIDYFTTFSKSINPFEVCLNGFGNFAPHTIYVNVSTKTPIIKIAREMRIKFGKLLKQPKLKGAYFCTNPHLTIARQMTNNQHDKAWEEWKYKEYASTFEANEMLLLKRKITGGKYETIVRFPFGGNGFSNEQLMLPL